jgi:two-component system CheB/CheR fusion protein
MADEGLRVFIVEDHDDTLKYLKLYLEQSGHRVEYARSLRQATESLPSSDCDVLISDVQLPDGSGWDLLKLAAPRRPLFAVVMSGFGMTADLKRSRAAGYRHHIVKPIDPDVLDRILEEAARERRKS